MTLNPDGADRRAPRAAPVRLSPPAVHARGHRARSGSGREVSGVNRTHYCGAYWFYGFHEDGLNSALRVAARARGRVVIDSGLFVGTLRHRRFAPVPHAFTYPLFMALLDIDRVPELMRVSRVTSYNRWNWASFDDRDHLGDPTRSLRDTARGRRDAPRDRPAGRPHLPADAPAVSRLRLQPRLVLLLLRCRRAAAGRPRGSEQHLRRVATTTGCGRIPRRARSARRPRSRSTCRRSCRSTSTTRSPSRRQRAAWWRTWRPVRPARLASTRRCRSSAGPGTRRRSGGRSSGIRR